MNIARLASVVEMESNPFRALLERLDKFALAYGLRKSCGLSKDWEYCWLLFHAILDNIKGINILDIGSELSPVPWYIAFFNRVSLVETKSMEECLKDKWEAISRSFLHEWIDYAFVKDETLPFGDNAFDLVTSFSVIEHQPNKVKAISEAIRVLKPGGTFAISFDVVEPSLGMTYPPEIGQPLTLDQFERLIWFRPEFGNKERPTWNMEDVPAFIEWHRRGKASRLFPEPREEPVDNPRNNYAVGAAVLKKL